jgi:anthranilate synthase component 1
LTLWPDRVEERNGGPAVDHPPSEFFPLIRRTLDDWTLNSPLNLPAVGSLMGYIGFDAVRLIEDIGPARTEDMPIARLVFPSAFVIFDHRRRVMNVVALAENEADGRTKIAAVEAGLSRGMVPSPSPSRFEVAAPDKKRYMDAVVAAKEYIRAGDIFQVVLADRFQGRTDVSPFEVYRRLRVKSPSPYMFFQDFGDYRILGASPETLVKVDGDQVFVRPIAGTRGRSSRPLEDQALERELLASDKERAEHVMLVDLGRNDVGRVSQYGSVSVAPYMSVERYSHVMHLVSEVRGRLRPDADVVDAFMAGFPAGTVSGAPKVRAMEIIDQLETRPRGPYSGAIGYFGPGGDMDTCIAIRMMLFRGDRFSVPVGAGIVADSVPEMEYKEIENKSAQSLAAIRAALGGEL